MPRIPRARNREDSRFKEQARCNVESMYHNRPDLGVFRSEPSLRRARNPRNWYTHIIVRVLMYSFCIPGEAPDAYRFRYFSLVKWIFRVSRDTRHEKCENYLRAHGIFRTESMDL